MSLAGAVSVVNSVTADDESNDGFAVAVSELPPRRGALVAAIGCTFGVDVAPDSDTADVTVLLSDEFGTDFADAKIKAAIDGDDGCSIRVTLSLSCCLLMLRTANSAKETAPFEVVSSFSELTDGEEFSGDPWRKWD